MNKDNIDGQKIHCNKIKKELSSVAEVAWGPQHQYQEWGDVAFSWNYKIFCRCKHLKL